MRTGRMWKRLRWWIRRGLKRYLYRRGWRYCPCCRKFVEIKWVQDVVLFEDEPPMFSHWECSNCGATTPVSPTILTEDAVRRLGYKDFSEYCRKVLKRKEA